MRRRYAVMLVRGLPRAAARRLQQVGRASAGRNYRHTTRIRQRMAYERHGFGAACRAAEGRFISDALLMRMQPPAEAISPGASAMPAGRRR